MIYILTCDPTLDVTVCMSRFNPGQTNKADSITLRPGGNGMQIALMLARLGITCHVLGFVSGDSGQELVNLLQREGCNPEMIDLPDGSTRMRLLLCADQQTEVITPSPNLALRSLSELHNRLKQLHSEDYLILADELSPTIHAELYETILPCMQARGVHCITDLPNHYLRNSLQYAPFLVKQDCSQLSQFFQVNVQETDATIFYARRLQSCGARNVLISLEGRGAILVTENGELLRAPVPRGQVISNKGTNSSIIAGFLAGWLENGTYHAALERAICASHATASTEWLADRTAVYDLVSQYRAEGAVL